MDGKSELPDHCPGTYRYTNRVHASTSTPDYTEKRNPESCCVLFSVLIAIQKMWCYYDCWIVQYSVLRITPELHYNKSTSSILLLLVNGTSEEYTVPWYTCTA